MKRFALSLALVVVISAGVSLASAAENSPKPNILFLLSDDHSYPYLGCYGCPDLNTPALDQFAADGLRCDRFFVSCPQCVPSRAALMTGRSPVAVRMVRFTSPLPDDVVALPDLLRDHGGYFTGVGGRSYHLDGPATGGKRAAPVLGGVMDRLGLRTFTKRVDYVEQKGANVPSGKKLEEFLAAAPAGKPWFFWLGFSDPHHPWDTQSPAGRRDPAKLTLPPHLPDLPEVREDLARYLAEVEHLDGEVAQVLEVLKARGLAENTLVVFMGDNGMAMPHGKGALTDPGIHVPLLVRWPGVVTPGRTSRELLSGEDFAPTMLSVAGISPPKSMSGLSFLPLLRDAPHEPRKFIFAERGPHGGDGGMKPDILAATFDLARCVRSNDFKLVYNCTPHQAVAPVDSRQDPGWLAMEKAHAEGKLVEPFVKSYFTTPRSTFELYDLNADPGEMNNLSGKKEFAKVERDLKEALTEKMVLDWDFLPTPLR
ncbi:MAG: sulfatase [Pirellulales bacterium]